MSGKTHCDLCDEVIAPTVQYLTLTLGLWTGDRGHADATTRDICPVCVGRHSILLQFFNEQRELDLRKLDVRT